MLKKSKLMGRIAWLALLVGIVCSFDASAQETPKAILVDSFGYTNAESGSARIDAWRLQLETSPDNAGLIIVYGSRTGKRGEIEAHIRGINKAFALKRIDHQRSPVINGGYREKLTVEFWVVPLGADNPKPTPTVEKKDLRLKGVSRKTVPYECC